MKFVFFGYDFSIDIAHRLMSDGHQLMAVFSFETDNIFSFHDRLKNLAQSHSIPFYTAPVSGGDITACLDQGAEIFIAAGYPHKIPPIDDDKAYHINFHPTLLPQGRGVMPMPTLFLHHPEHCGLTLHKIAPEFDSGDILYQEKMTLHDWDDIDSLSARIVMRAPEIFSDVLHNIETYWQEARPQEGEGSWWKAPDDQARSFDWTQSVDQINKMIRAFGSYGMIAEFDGTRWAVFLAKAWSEDHNLKPGEVVCRLSREIVIAAADGYVMLKQFQKIEG